MDFNKFIELFKGGLFEPDSTWASYAAKRAPWLDTAMAFTLPLILGSGLLALVFGYLFSSFSLFGSAGFGGFIAGIIGGSLGVALWAAIASFFARMFDSGAAAAPAASSQAASATDDSLQINPESQADDGQPQMLAAGAAPTFDQGVAAVSFAFIPGFVGSVLGTVPWIGGLLSFVAMIYALVLLYRCFPVFLGVAEDNRVKHYVATLITGIIAGIVLFAILGGLGLGATSGGLASSSGGLSERLERQMEERLDTEASGSRSTKGEADGGLFGIGRQTEYIEAASSDAFTPPKDGKLSKAQVRTFVRFLTTTKEMRDQSSQRLKDIADKAEGEENPSLSDFFGGLRDVMDVGTAEMQVVKSGGGNWAEHEWIKKALFEARLHKDLNDAIRHNWSLYSDHAEVLDELL